MEHTRKWSGWILIALLLLLTLIVLGIYTFGNSEAEGDAAQVPVITVRPSASGASDKTANASVMGYGGPVLVRLTLNDEGKIAALDVGGARFAETEGVGSRVKDENFTHAFIGLKPPLSLGDDIDAVSGATVSSQAVVNAVNEAAAFLEQETSQLATN